MSVKQILKHKIAVYRPFIISVIATSFVWLVASMSDVKNYPSNVHVDYINYDTARFSIVSADATIELNIASNGFNAFLNNFSIKHQHVTVDLKPLLSNVDLNKETMQYNLSTAEMIDEFEKQLDLSGVSSISAKQKTLHLTLAQRRRRAYAPQIKNVDFNFASGCGIYGEPRIEPDTVYLYGSLNSLNKIESIATAPATVANIDKSGSYMLDLDPVWKKYPDIRPSTNQVQVFIPVKTFTEKTFTLPIHFQSSDTSFKVHLYPETVEVTCWVSANDFTKVKASDFGATVHYNPNNAETHLNIILNRFPNYVRIKSIKPNKVQFVIIK